ncbi:MAG: hypothetical protein HUK21_06380 [Fibrobacteraceae bacterium]|nr:hypothetical protein [Fibrobacteraceae bacterium]
MKKYLLLSATLLTIAACDSSSSSSAPDDQPALSSVSQDVPVSSSASNGDVPPVGISSAVDGDIPSAGVSSSSGSNGAVSEDPSVVGDYVIDQYATYKIVDGAITVTHATCSVEGGSLVWNPTGAVNTIGYAFDPATNKIVAQSDEDFLPEPNMTFNYLGTTFPEGIWQENIDSKVAYGLIFENGENLKMINFYDKNCLTKAFERFSDDLAGGEVVDCNTIDFDGIKMVFTDMGSDFFDISYVYGGISCPAHMKNLYENSEADCNNAYAQFLVDEEAEPEFSFGDYSTDGEPDDDCMLNLLLTMMQDNGVDLNDLFDMDDENALYKKAAKQTPVKAFKKKMKSILNKLK